MSAWAAPAAPWPTGMVSVQGPRPTMEDRHVLAAGAGGLFGGVYDGHGGRQMADAAAEHLHVEFFAALGEGLSAEDAFLRAYGRTDDAVSLARCGATATTFFLAGRGLTVAHAGDGRVALVSAGATTALTRDHRLDEPHERARVLAAGAGIDGRYVYRDDFGVMPTRVLGDRWLRPVGVIATPEVSSRRLGAQDRWLVVACDGLWDVVSTAEAGELVRGAAGPQAAADALARMVGRRRGQDNLTILVVALAR